MLSIRDGVGDYEDKKSSAHGKTPATKLQKLKRGSERNNSNSVGSAKVRRQSSAPNSDEREIEIVAAQADSSRGNAKSSPRQAKRHSPSRYDPCQCADDAMPLDMSKKCPVAEQQRPSVITCASTLMRKAQEKKSPGKNPTNRKTERGTSSRREIVSGMCDPVIDEHFRRSLGKDYTEIFSAPTAATSVSITVDDHFAKALGETWQRLQEKPTAIPPSSVKPKETEKSAKLGSSAPRGLVTL